MMKRFECNQCGNSGPCVMYSSGIITHWNGKECGFCNNGIKYRWKLEVSEPLPKLTAEALAERGIEWPERAACAVVDDDEKASFCSDSEVKIETAYGDPGYWDTTGDIIPGNWDASDWQNSKIMRPEKEHGFPDWCKVGAWLCNRSITFSAPHEFAQIKNIAGEGHLLCIKYQNGRDDVLSSIAFPRIGFIAARVRPWTKEDGPLILKLKYKGKFATALLSVGGTIGWGYVVDQDGFSKHITMKEIADNGIQLDGSPCGVLEAVEAE